MGLVRQHHWRLGDWAMEIKNAFESLQDKPWIWIKSIQSKNIYISIYMYIYIYSMTNYAPLVHKILGSSGSSIQISSDLFRSSQALGRRLTGLFLTLGVDLAGRARSSGVAGISRNAKNPCIALKMCETSVNLYQILSATRVS